MDQTEGKLQLLLAEDIVLDLLDWSEEKDPGRILMDSFADEDLAPWGPQHHVLLTAALLTAYRNNGYELNLTQALSSAIQGIKEVASCTCTHGNDCSLGKAAAVFLAIILEYSPHFSMDEKARNHHCQTLRDCCLSAFPTVCRMGRRHCCKMHGFIAIEVTCRYLKEELGINLPLSPIFCDLAVLHPECQFSYCPYFTGHSSGYFCHSN